MGKVSHFQKIILQFLQYYQEATNNKNSPINRRIIADLENNSFQLLAVGWNGSHYIFSPIFHFDIINDKIWMQCNNTEWEVVDYLMEHGVDKKDIVLGFVAPQARRYSGFAEA
ncbi:MAG TPA: XisI protein [Saprospiraceae bacterium]|nr:XisI protein [Saprospiraceae bacterium]HMQ82347.1 XisI protein [Saprospiraceae bacterium]